MLGFGDSSEDEGAAHGAHTSEMHAVVGSAALGWNRRSEGSGGRYGGNDSSHTGRNV